MDVQAMLCDYATVVGGKLFVTGASINIIGAPAQEPPLRVSVALAILVAVPWNATNQAHRLTVELVADSPEGQQRIALTSHMTHGQESPEQGMIIAQFNVGRSPITTPGDDSLLPIALPMMGLELPGPGGFFFVIRVDGNEVRRVSFRLESQLTLIGG